MKRLVAYGWALAILQAVALVFAQPAFAKSKLVLAFGDSLTAGYGLKPNESFPAQLQAALVKGGIPAAPFIIGFILGPMAETNFRRGLMLSDGNFMGFITSPIAGSFLGLAALVIVWQVWGALRDKPSKADEILRA